MKIEVSAPGKTILHGEHAVVYGKAAVAVSVSLRTSLTLISHENKVVLNLKNLGLMKEWDLNVLNDYSFPDADGDITPVNEEILEKITQVFILNSECYSESQKLALVAFLYLWIYISKCYNNGSFISCIVDIDSELSVGSGMGSSASYSVCLATAMLVFCGRTTPSLLPEDKELINKWAFQAERIFHGKPSGIDNSICTYGGALLFENGKVVDMLTNLPTFSILLVNTNVPRNTKLLVSNVKQKHELYPSVVEAIINAIDAISKENWQLMKNLQDSPCEINTLNKFEDLIEMNHHLLNGLGVGHAKLDDIHDIAKKYSYSSKLTGAGGGGCAIVFLYPKNGDSSFDMLKMELQHHEYEVYDIFMGCTGVQVKFQGQ
ncbi:mevalonate kinase [Trichonephila inaurata madagascariensis]|uniref:Mevalonate kinase n=1 Tax=Trichonephila inaurata madagascariensis TaxID=2747483 RepID=A0A8X6JMR8_9ARAC|nr:mevalonate kinase [Trichonephila inaurata madagascariensis]